MGILDETNFEEKLHSWVRQQLPKWTINEHSSPGKECAT